MSDIFHKSCYTSRSTGYKYRTLSTNTGDKASKENKETNVLDRKFKELKNAIIMRINKEVDDTQSARFRIEEKFNKVDAKINSMLELQNTVTMLRKDLQLAEDVLCSMVERLENLEKILVISETSSFQSRSYSFIKHLYNSYQDY